MSRIKLIMELSKNSEFVEINCEGKNYSYPKCYFTLIPWFQNQTHPTFPFSKFDLDRFLQWMVAGGECPAKIWSFMFKCSPVSASLMHEIPEDFRIPGTGIVIDGALFHYEILSEISEYFKVLYSRDYYANYEIRDTSLGKVVEYFVYERLQRNKHFGAAELEIADKYLMMTVCGKCDKREFCACRFSPCRTCNSIKKCDCVCWCCKGKITRKDVLDACGKCTKCVRKCQGCYGEQPAHGLRYCADCKCVLDRCENAAKYEAGTACEYHICADEYCSEAVKCVGIYDVSCYCPFHACTTEGCLKVGGHDGDHEPG